MYLCEESMPQVAFELNKQGTRTKKGKRWNARAVRDILTNEIYIGKYNVAGVNANIEECRIVDDKLFKKAEETRLRHKMGGAKRPSMPRTRKVIKIDRVFNKFLELINSQEKPDESAVHKQKVIRDEKELIRLLQDGWSLLRIADDKFVIEKNATQSKQQV